MLQIVKSRANSGSTQFHIQDFPIGRSANPKGGQASKYYFDQPPPPKKNCVKIFKEMDREGGRPWHPRLPPDPPPPPNHGFTNATENEW